MNLSCPLCSSTYHNLFAQDTRRIYRQCTTCKTVFVPPQYFLSSDEERERYDLHTNSPDDTAYRKFLQRMLLPMHERIPKKSFGLDFGSGPGPTLSLMFEEYGHTMQIYDCFYAPDEKVFSRRYDFISATEVVEHLHRPLVELDRLWRLLKPGGYLGIMTSRYDTVEAFDRWHYKLDPTHILFFSTESFRWLCKRWHALLELIDNDIVILRKRAE